MRKLVWIAALFMLAAVLGCSRGCGKPAPGERTQVVVSIFPIYDLVRRVAGPDADVTLILPRGRSEHSYQPGPKDAERAARAGLGVMVGLGLDSWMEELMRGAPKGARILKVGDRVPTLPVKGSDERGDEREGGVFDPHVWLDPQRAQLIVRAIAEELGRIDAAHALAYRARATELDESLVALDGDAEQRLKTLAHRELVTFHGSFEYFAERYKLSIVAVIAPVPGSPPSQGHLTKVLTTIKDRNLPALFTEPQLDPRPAKVLAEDAEIPLGVLDPIGGSPETDTYEKMVRFNVAALEKHLK